MGMKKKEMGNKRHRETEPDFSKKGFQWKLPLGPGKTLLTLFCICILCFSLSSDIAWLIGYQFTVYFLYIGVFSTTLMLMIDISSIIEYYKNRGKDLPEKVQTDQESLKKRYRRLMAQRYDGKGNVLLMPKGKRDELIKLHESLYPEDQPVMNAFFKKFLDDAAYDFSDDIANIKYIIYTAEPCYRIVILRSLPYIRLEQYKDTVLKRNERYNYFINKISIKLSNLKELDKEPNPYGVFFHELSHAVDDVSCTDLFLKVRHSVDQYSNEAGERLQEIARREAKNHVAESIRACVEKEQRQVSMEEENKLLEDIFSPNTEYGTFTNPEVEAVYQTIRKSYGYTERDKGEKKMFLHRGEIHPLYQRKYRAVSDVLGGYTQNTVGACPVGHFMPFYWFNLLGNETRRQSRELWAEYSSYLITGDKECRAGTEQFFPESCAFIRYIWKEELAEKEIQ